MERTKHNLKTKEPTKQGFFKNYRVVLEHFGLEEGSLLCFLMDEDLYRRKTKSLKMGMWYKTYDDMGKELKLSPHKLRSLGEKLEENDVLRTKLMMRPLKKYYKINWNYLINGQTLKSLTVKEFNYYTLRNLTVINKTIKQGEKLEDKSSNKDDSCPVQYWVFGKSFDSSLITCTNCLDNDEKLFHRCRLANKKILSIKKNT